uniref:DDE_Tnp_IS1595 domain-containing protein n=1 Tax=Trichuris muris TaxID=70415 RepID=A0A5S6Q554_TRIMR
MSFNIFEVCERFKEEEAAIRFLQEKGALHQHRTCTRGHAMKYCQRTGRHGPRWRCQKGGGGEEVPVRRGTWFDGEKLELKKALVLIYSWSRGYTRMSFCSRELGISSNCAVAMQKRLREVAAESLLRDPLVIGGPGLTVEVDETAFSKRKYQRGRMYPTQWVLGGVCRETGECFLVPVGNRSSQTLLPLIRQYVRPGTTVITDEWRGYRGLAGSGYTHLTVNHSLQFVQPETGAHTQTVESLWAQVKRSNKLRCGTPRRFLDSYLCEFMWRRRLRPRQDPFDCIVNDIATYWPPQ